MKRRPNCFAFLAPIVALALSTCALSGTAYGFFGWFEKSKEEKAKEEKAKGKKGTASIDDQVPLDLDWSTLRALDPISGTAPEVLQAVDGKLVRVAGFIVPLEDSQKSVSEFLLVPSPQACIHVPPPPPNQIIHVKMSPGAGTKMNYGPVWVKGRLRITEVSHAYGKASFDMVGEATEPYD